MKNQEGRNAWLLGGLIFLLAIAAHAPALRGGFIWDDDDHFAKNPAMVEPGGLGKIWTSLAVSRYYPLTLTTFWAEHRLWGLNPLPYHAVNVILHGLTAMSIFLVLRQLKVTVAWVSAALWAVHPVAVESVAWVTELKNTQSGLFFFLSILAFLRHRETRQRGWYVMALLCGVASMLSKPSTVVLPVVLLLCACWESGCCVRADWLLVTPLFAFASGMSVLTIVQQQGDIDSRARDWSLSMAERFALAGKAVWFYVWKTLWPANLTFVYPRWDLAGGSLASLLPLVVLAGAGAVLWQMRNHPWARAGLFGLAYFIVALLPVLGFFDIFYFRYSYVADHFQYLACVGVISLVCAAGAAALQNRAAQTAVAMGAVVVLSGISWRHSQAFHDPETLWRDTLAKNPACWMAHNNLAALLMDQGKTDEAIAQHREALQIKEDDAPAHNDLGYALLTEGKTEDAVVHFTRALEINPGSTEARENLGVALVRQGKVTEGVAEFAEFARRQPNDPRPYNNWGAALLLLGRNDEAAEQFRKAYTLATSLGDTALAETARTQLNICEQRKATAADRAGQR